MDYDNDGILDFISGSYDPGDVYLFRGLGEGNYAERETIVDENDVPLVHHPVEMAKFEEMGPEDHSEEATTLRVASFGSWVAAADWDADQDLDMLIGSFGGKLFLRENIGTREEPKYSGESIEINANGKPIKESCHAAPVIADWDSDGVFDLVIGSGDGSVGWYKNTGSVSSPEFGERNLLVSPAYVRSDIAQAADKDAHAAKFMMQVLSPEEAAIPGARAQICVHDYNQDGMLDLIVGDYSNIDVTRELSKKEQSQFDAIKPKQKEIGKKLSALQGKLYGEENKDLEESEKEKLEKDYQAIVSEYMKLDEERKTFFAKSGSASFVWLYLRKPGAAERTFVSAKNEPDNSEIETEDPVAKEPEDNEGAPVGFDAKVERVDGKQQLRVEFDINPDWHLYADSGSSGNKEVAVEVELPEGVSTIGAWEKPSAQMSLKSPGQKLYKGIVVFTQELKMAPDAKGEINVKISYQVCNEKMCLAPTTENLSVMVE